MSGILLYHSSTESSVPDQTVKEATSTLEPLRTDGALAEQTHAPEWNEFDSDESGQLVGLAPRLAGSDTIDREQYPAWWIPGADANHNVIIDDQVSSSGTAAAREDAGIQGHGTMQYAIGIEPVLRPGAAFGNDYFLSNPAVIQDGAGSYMTPTPNDQWAQAVAQSGATRNSRAAYSDSLYAALLG